jgi:lactate dehydrogenase-like 2-hydroxyacid dehydrogenase
MSGRSRVLITDFITNDLEPERKMLDDLTDVEALNAYSEDELIGRVEDADALALYHNLGIYRKSIERLERRKVALRGGVGIDNVDHAFARERGIPVDNVPD